MQDKVVAKGLGAQDYTTNVKAAFSNLLHELAGLFMGIKQPVNAKQTIKTMGQWALERLREG